MTDRYPVAINPADQPPNYPAGYPSGYPPGYPSGYPNNSSNNEPQVVVYILSSDPDSQRTQRVRSLFDNGLFMVRISQISPPKSLQNTTNQTSNQTSNQTAGQVQTSSANVASANQNISASASATGPATVATSSASSGVAGVTGGNLLATNAAGAPVNPPANATPNAASNTTPNAASNTTSNAASNQAVESYRYQWCLDNARRQYPDKYVLIVKDTSVSNSSPERIADIISSAIVAGGWDVFYLCRWQDRCDLYTDKRPISGMTTLLAKTVSPHGTQALLFSPHGRDVVLGRLPMSDNTTFNIGSKPLGNQLNNAIAKGSLSAQCAVPNLIEYDVTAAKSASDYRKLAECALTGLKSNLQQTSNASWIWVIIIILIVLLIVWFISRSNKTY